MKTVRLAVAAMAMAAFLGCGSYGDNSSSSDSCAGVDTSQAPGRIERIEYPGGHVSETYYWGCCCSRTYYY